MNHYAFVETNFLWSTIKLTFQRRVKCDGYHVLKALPGLGNNFQLGLSQTAHVQRWGSEWGLLFTLLAQAALGSGRTVLQNDFAEGI